jgi:NAD(P)H-dependent FMN reductase
MATTLKVIGIQGSPHPDGMTARLVDRALAGARAEGAQTDLLRLADEELVPCQACGGDCFGTQICVRDKAATVRHARLQDADGMVFGAPVYCWQLSGLSALFIDKMRWNTGSVLSPRNRRAALGIACAGGSGTGCVIALQALYRYFYNWAFHGIEPLPVTRFNFEGALSAAEERGALLVRTLRAGVKPFTSMGQAMAHCDSLPYMRFGPVDELALVVEQMREGLSTSGDPEAIAFIRQAGTAAGVQPAADRAEALSAAYFAGAAAWGRLGQPHG